MPGLYPQTVIVSTCDLVQAFQNSIPHVSLRKADYAEIIEQIMIVMLDSFHTFRFSLAQLPNFMPLYPNESLVTQANKEELAIAVHSLGLGIYARLESMGAFVPQNQCGGQGFFPYHLDRLVSNDIVLSFIDDNPVC